MNDTHLRFLELLRKWSAAMALVSSADRKSGLERHLEDARAVLPHVPAEARRLVDVGAGAGFPGAVLAMERPELEVVALEPHKKKWAFLRTVRRELALENFVPLAERDEEHLAREDFEPYDAAVSRATFSVPEWLERGLALVRPGAPVLAMEGRERHPLPPGAERHPYEQEGRSRAIVVRLREGPG